MTENMKNFLELASNSEELKNRLSEASKDELIAIAKENGIALTDADFEQSSEVSDDELDTVVGGKKCNCFLGGGGTASEGQRTCACVAVGVGEMLSGGMRCMCCGSGIGGNSRNPSYL